jgi:nitrate reductase gamma subunit
VTLAVYLVVATSTVIFATACVWRVLLFARSPLHLRWELYPVPHEAPERVAHGGSYFEESEWWRRAPASNFAAELTFMVREMLFLLALRTFNRPLWYRSFPFHFGLYLLAGSLALALGSLGASAFTGWRPFAAALSTLAKLAGAAGLLSGIIGAVGLLHRRLTDPALRVSTTSGDILNLLFFIVALALLGAGYVARPVGSPGAGAVLSGLLSWDLAVAVPAGFGLGIIASAALAAYIPLTHMSHFIAKYFTYHSVRWDDEPAVRNERRARAMAEYLAYRPTWSAAHIRGGESRTWAQIVAQNPSREPKA